MFEGVRRLDFESFTDLNWFDSNPTRIRPNLSDSNPSPLQTKRSLSLSLPADELVVDFPVLLVTHIDGRQIKTFYTYDKDYFVYVFNNTPLIGKAFLLPFLIVSSLSPCTLTGFLRLALIANSSLSLSLSLSLSRSQVIGACIIVIISFMISQIIRCYNERKKRRRHRLAKRHLKKIPTINFKKGDHYEICAICLDEFQEGVKLRLLTCRCHHFYNLLVCCPLNSAQAIKTNR